MKSIRTKLWAGIMVLVGIIILLLWLFQIVFLEQFYANLEMSAIKTKVNTLVERIERESELNEIGDFSDVAELMNDFVNEKQVALQILDTSGILIYQAVSNSSAMPGMFREALVGIVPSALQGKEGSILVKHPRFGNEFTILAVPIERQSRIEGVMVVTVPMASVESTVDILKRQMMIIILVLVSISVPLAFRLARVFTKPIFMISNIAESYARGNFSSRVPTHTKDEIGQLANRMNEMGEALERNEILQKELVANVSHELRTPLTLIQGYAETLRDVTGQYPDKREKQLGVIVEETKRLSRIVEDILSLSQLQAGAVTIEQESFSLTELLLRIKERYDMLKEARTFRILGLDVLTTNLVGDQGRIEQVFYNLINNAFHHTEKEDTVEVNIVDGRSIVRIEVRDSGLGIAKQDLKYVFDRYYRGKRNDGTNVDGTGLGLAIVKSILKMHQVAYGVESTLGQGTTFWFELRKDDSHTSF